MLKHIRVNFELTDVDMILFIEGGLSQYSNRHAQANNKYMQSYNPIEIIDLMYVWRQQPVRLGNASIHCHTLIFWVDDVNNFDVMMMIALDSPMDYVLKVDLEYPQHVHDAPIYHFV